MWTVYAQCVNSVYTVHNNKNCLPKSTNAGQKKKKKKQKTWTYKRGRGAQTVTLWPTICNLETRNSWPFFIYFQNMNSYMTNLHKDRGQNRDIPLPLKLSSKMPLNLKLFRNMPLCLIPIVIDTIFIGCFEGINASKLINRLLRRIPTHYGQQFVT